MLNGLPLQEFSDLSLPCSTRLKHQREAFKKADNKLSLPRKLDYPQAAYPRVAYPQLHWLSFNMSASG